MTELSIQRGVLSIQGAPLYYEIAGSGQPLLLLHAGVADSRMWDEHFSKFARSYRVIRYDQRGFGQSEIPARRFAYYEDAHEILTHFACKRTHIVGISFGSKVALDFALAYPELVSSLVLVSPSIGGRKPTADILQFNQQEEELLARGDLASAAELNVRMWVDGPRRSPEQVEAAVRQRIYDMQYHAFTIPEPEGMSEVQLQPPASERLHELHVPTLVVAGDLDVEEKLQLAHELETGIVGARRVIVPGTAHMLTMEQPNTFRDIVFNFLQQIS